MDTKTLCLGALNRGAASGYEIKKAFEEGPLRHIHEASFGSIYPALTALSEEGLVVCTEMAQDKRPDKKVYSITDKGRAALFEALMAPPARDKVRSDFLFIMFFAQLLPPARLAELIDQRIAWYRECLGRMESCDPSGRPPGEIFVHGLGLAVYRAAAEYLAAHRDRLLDEVSAGARLVAE
ncbi:MAG: PadR family transcriptional regulator [Kiloniellaceae bacterium]